MPVFLYFVTEKGLVAVSFDEGLTIILPSGKALKPTEVWEETDEDLEHRLSDAQLAALRLMRQAPVTELDALVQKHLHRTIRDNQGYRQARAPAREVGENALVIKSDLDD